MGIRVDFSSNLKPKVLAASLPSSEIIFEAKGSSHRFTLFENDSMLAFGLRYTILVTAVCKMCNRLREAKPIKQKET